MARPKDRATDGRQRRADVVEEHRHPSHRAARRLALGALVLLVGGYVALVGFQRQTPDRSAAEYCRQVAAVTSLDEALGELDGGRAHDAFTQLEGVDRVAPTDIEPQLRTVIDASRPLVDALQTPGSDPEGAVRQVVQSHQADVQKVDAAAKAVQTYTAATCHRDLETTVPETTPPSSVAATSTTAFAPAKPSTSSSVKAVPPPASTPR